jgi:cytochrome c-type biogenesis protein CcmH
MIIALVVIAILLLILVIFGVRLLSNRRDNEISIQLRTLLQAQEEGSVTEDEFLRRQAALYAALLAPKPNLNRNYLGLGAFIVTVVAVVGIYKLQSKPQAKLESPSIEFNSAGPLDTHFGTAINEPKQTNIGGDLNVMVKRLADKMAKNPSDADGWLLLARTYTEINQMKEAASAYAKAAALLPPNAALFSDWANAYVMANDGKWDAEAKLIVKRALDTDAKNVKALSLAGTEAFSRADYKTAITYWKRMLAASEVGSMEAKLAQENLHESEALLSGKKSTVPTIFPADQSVTGVEGTVTLEAKLKGQTAPTDTVFIVARAPDGSNPPLAVKRLNVSDLPAHFLLDDSSAMIPSRTLSKYSEVILIARISKSGQAAPAPGDIEAKPINVKLGSRTVKLNLSSVR